MDGGVRSIISRVPVAISVCIRLDRNSGSKLSDSMHTFSFPSAARAETFGAKGKRQAQLLFRGVSSVNVARYKMPSQFVGDTPAAFTGLLGPSEVFKSKVSSWGEGRYRSLYSAWARRYSGENMLGLDSHVLVTLKASCSQRDSP